MQTHDPEENQIDAQEEAALDSEEGLEDDFESDEEDFEDEQQPDSAAASELEGLVAYIAARLVHEPDTVEVDSEYRGGTVYISLRVPESEMGRVIGREGRTAKAIRTLVSIAGSRHNVHARLDIEG
ncbi:MAG TPA: KH domain-containing protein [Thermomicrobiales bacterium]|nr:KH domain-containing protein [Thermomicrobiales bacterium]